MKKNIITISREFGSGGGMIGKMVAEQLEIPCYDREMIASVARETGFDPAYLEGLSSHFEDLKCRVRDILTGTYEECHFGFYGCISTNGRTLGLSCVVVGSSPTRGAKARKHQCLRAFGILKTYGRKRR